MRTSVQLESVGAFLEGRHPDPLAFLGAHVVERPEGRCLAVRAFLPDAAQAWVVHPGHAPPRPMRRIHPAGVFEAFCPAPETADGPRYALRVANQHGELTTMHDPYQFDFFLSDFDRFLFGEGTHVKVHQKLGAQIRECPDPRGGAVVRGVNFAVWAPNARAVSVVGDFNQWDGRRHPLRKQIPSGVWEIFVPDLGPGEKYKYRVTGEHGEVVDKADPYGFAAELPPHTASLVWDQRQYAWGDAAWLEKRRTADPLKRPLSVFEVHLGSWRRGGQRSHGWLSYRDLAHQLVEYCQQLGFTHLELLPVSEHPYSGSWGYQTVGYFAPTSRHGTPDDFKYFVDYCHRHDIGVLVDWVPAHFPRDAHGLRRFDGSALYEHADPRQGEHPDWGTMIFNYGRNEVRTFLLSNAMFWLDEFHIDGLRVDAVASMLYLDYSREQGQWVPNRHGGRENLEAISLLRDFNIRAHDAHPGVLTIAEESTAWAGVSRPTYTGGLGFSLKWNMGWMNDTLRYMRKDAIHRKHHHDELTFSLIYAFHENFVLPLSHDEVVHGKCSLLSQMSGDSWQKFANLRLLYAYMWTHPGKKLLFMGGEFGQWFEWSHDHGLQWDLLQWAPHQGLQKLVGDLNQVYRREPALHQVDFESRGFEWVDCHSREDSVLAFIRRGDDPHDFVVVCCNFTPVVRRGHRVGVPQGGWYREILNTDSQFYGGGNVGTHPGVPAHQPGWHGRPWTISINLPPLAVVVFKPSAPPS